MKVDLHCHSEFSDGAHPPEFVVARARSNGVSHLAITDHDCVAASDVLRTMLPIPGIDLISGVEISTRWETAEIHILGLCVDESNDALNALLTLQQQRRRDRLEVMHTALVRSGISGLLDYMGNLPTLAPGRSHVANFLVEQGHSRSRQKAFKSYLGRGGRCYCEPQWCGINEAIGAIRNAGGIAVLAHPHRYGFGTSRLARLVQEFNEMGGEGLELCGPSMDPAILRKLVTLAQRFELRASAGSDFHSSAAPWSDLGKLPDLPTDLIKNAIWLHPRWHSMRTTKSFRTSDAS